MAKKCIRLRDAFRILSNNYDGTFYENSYQLKALNYFRKKFHQMFVRNLKTHPFVSKFESKKIYKMKTVFKSI